MTIKLSLKHIIVALAVYGALTHTTAQILAWIECTPLSRTDLICVVQSNILCIHDNTVFNKFICGFVFCRVNAKQQ